jgi:RNA polymerase sigma-70 factor (ECF subfamily)
MELDAALTQPLVGRREAGAVAQADTRVRGLVDAHFDVVWRTLWRCGVPRGSVDDAAQQVFLVATRKLDQIDPATERAYLLGIAVRVAADARRSQRRLREVPHDDEDGAPLGLEGPATPEELVDQKRARELLDTVLASMPEELRDALVLFEIEGVPIAQIAEALEIPVGTVGSRIRRARDLFQKKVDRLVRASDIGSGT